MSEAQDPNNTNADHLSSPNQETSADWVAIGNIIASALINAAHSTPPSAPPSEASREKQSTDWWARGLSIATLVITIAIQGVLALVIHSQDQHYQTNLLNMQASATAQASFAHLTIACTVQCNQGFTIFNSSRTDTQNLTVVIDLVGINPPWSSFIDRIDRIQIIPDPALRAQIKSQKNSTLVESVPKNNEYLISLDNLGPQTPFTIGFNADKYLNSKTLFKKYTSTSNIKFYLSSSEEKTLSTIFPGPHAPPLNYDILNIIGKYFNDNYFTIASLSVMASCNHCEGVTDYINPLSFQNQQYENFIVTSGSVLPNFNLSSSQPMPVQDGYVWQIPVDIEYSLPNGVTPLAIPSSLSLQLKNLGIDNPIINQCQPTDCTNFA